MTEHGRSDAAVTPLCEQEARLTEEQLTSPAARSMLGLWSQCLIRQDPWYLVLVLVAHSPRHLAETSLMGGVSQCAPSYLEQLISPACLFSLRTAHSPRGLAETSFMGG